MYIFCIYFQFQIKDYIILYQLNSYQLKDKYNQAYIYFYLVSASLSLFVFLLPLKYLLEPHQSSSFLYHKESILVLVLIILLLFYLMFFDIVLLLFLKFFSCIRFLNPFFIFKIKVLVMSYNSKVSK